MLLSGCAAFQPPPDDGARLVGGHQAFLARYESAQPDARQAMLDSLGAEEKPDARTRLRHALLLSAPGATADSLEQSLSLYDELADASSLSQAERDAVRAWRADARERLQLRRQIEGLKADVAGVRDQLQQAQKQIEQLTIIEQQLESGQPDRDQADDQDGKQDHP